MTCDLDPLLHPYRADLAAAHLEGRVDAARFVEPRVMQVHAALAPVHAAPRGDAEMISQALFGEQVDVYEEVEGWAWGQLRDDAYVGYIPVADLGPRSADPTHRIAVPRSFLYPVPDIKAPPAATVTLNARIAGDGVEGDFLRLAGGTFLFHTHAAELGEHAPDFVAVAESLLGAPYLWGGKSIGGLDCSGLVQLACQAAGIAALRDTYMQRESLGQPLATTGLSGLRRGDILFWKRHIGIMSDAETLLHATAHAMLTMTEPVEQAVRRIAAAGLDLLQVNRL